MKELEIRKIKLYKCGYCNLLHEVEIEAFKCCTKLHITDAHVITDKHGNKVDPTWFFDLDDAVNECLKIVGKEKSHDGRVAVNINF